MGCVPIEVLLHSYVARSLSDYFANRTSDSCLNAREKANQDQDR